LNPRPPPRALAIARDISTPLEEARALEGTGRWNLLDGNPGDGAAHRQQALTIYQRIGTQPPGASRKPFATTASQQPAARRPKPSAGIPTASAHVATSVLDRALHP